MKIAIFLWAIVVFFFFIFPNANKLLQPVFLELDRWDGLIYKIVQGTVRTNAGTEYTEDFCNLLGFEYVKNIDISGFDESGTCVVESADAGLICYSGFQCSTGICEDDSNSPWYINFGPGSCTKYFQGDNVGNRVIFGLKGIE